MKIAILTYKFPPHHLSGLEMGADYMARHLAQKGHEVHVVVTRRDSGQSFCLDQYGYRLWRIPVVPLPFLRSFWEIVCASFMILWLRPEVLHGQALFPCGWLAGLWGRLLSCHSVVYLYGRDVCHPSKLLREFFGRQTLKWNLVVLAATKHCRQNALKIYQRDIEVFYSGFESPAPWPVINSPAHSLLFVGRLVADKGLDILLQALKEVEEPWTLKIVGEGVIESQFKNQAQRLGLGNKIEWLGRVENHQIYEIMSNSRVFVLPSREEPYGVVLLEALACGCRVVTTAVGGIPEIIDSPDKGLVVFPEDSQALARAINQIKKDSPLDREIVEKIRRDFNWSHCVEILERHYAH